MQNLVNKKCLITGANSGLGFETAKLLTRQGAKVIMLCRNINKADEAVRLLKIDNPKAQVEVEIANLASMKSVYDFTERFKFKHEHLDLLINNAAVLKPKFEKTANDYETMFQVNFLAPFMITNSLLGLLKNSNQAQIVNITLPPEKLQVDFDDLQSEKKFSAMEHLYKTKLYLLLYSLELAERVSNTNIKIISGVPNSKPFKSSLGREMPVWLRFLMKLISTDTEKVSKNLVSTINNNANKNGMVFKEQKQITLTPYWKNSNVRTKLWKIAENIHAKSLV